MRASTGPGPAAAAAADRLVDSSPGIILILVRSVSAGKLVKARRIPIPAEGVLGLLGDVSRFPLPHRFTRSCLAGGFGSSEHVTQGDR